MNPFEQTRIGFLTEKIVRKLRKNAKHLTTPATEIDYEYELTFYPCSDGGFEVEMVDESSADLFVVHYTPGLLDRRSS